MKFEKIKEKLVAILLLELTQSPIYRIEFINLT